MRLGNSRHPQPHEQTAVALRDLGHGGPTARIVALGPPTQDLAAARAAVASLSRAPRHVGGEQLGHRREVVAVKRGENALRSSSSTAAAYLAGAEQLRVDAHRGAHRGGAACGATWPRLQPPS